MRYQTFYRVSAQKEKEREREIVSLPVNMTRTAGSTDINHVNKENRYTI